MNIRILAFTLGTVVALSAPVQAFADHEAAPTEYKKVTKGGKYVFVLLAPQEWRKWGHLHKTYPSSGLYVNDGSHKPLWTVDWYARNVEVCSDGVHLVRWGPWPRLGDGGETLALAFYKNGYEVKSYRVIDLFPDYERFPMTVSHYRWSLNHSYDDVGKRVAFVPIEGYYERGPRRVFDIKSGEVLEPKHKRTDQANH